MTTKECLSYFDQVEHIMDNFDFKKIHAYMTLVDWKWRGESPTLAEVEGCARDCLEHVASGKGDICGTGGFHAERHDGDGLMLSFAIETVATCGSDE